MHLPIADTGDCTDGVTVTVIEVLDVPPVILTITSIKPDDSEPANCPDVNPTINTNSQMLITVIFCSSHYKTLTASVKDDSCCPVYTTCCYCWTK